ncbi:MAG: thioredoxin-disulfide reductase [Clostridiales Family XIII bacterium]|jgi:thioredoxin reductase (NADPH)|nr:thioredoxin-disulfide reductase [Clostridiales Family XIII bacterium]
MDEKTLYDVIILGAGPAGLSAAIYAGRSRLNTLLIEQGEDGGQIILTHEIENYPGQMPQGEPGLELVARMSEQAARFGAVRVRDRVTAVSAAGDVKSVTCEKGTYEGRTLILALGAYPRAIGCAGEMDFAGKGISYCATCDGNFFTGLDVYVAGGGDTAVQEALYLTRFARKVTIVHRRDELRAVKSLQEKAFANEKIAFLWDSVVEEAGGSGLLSRIKVRNVKTGEVTEIEAAEGFMGLFGFIGYVPRSELLEGQVATEDGYILTDEEMRTSVPGVFAAGDIRKKTLRQVITAAADGATAAISAERYLDD